MGNRPITFDDATESDQQRTFRFALFRWLGAIVGLNAAWEVAHAPLYRFQAGLDVFGRAWAIAHCTVGDLLIAIIAFGLTALTVRSRSWLIDRSVAGTLVFVGCAIAYTGYSEWLNVYVRSSWGYQSTMPTIFGIGLSPLLQWVVVPILATLAARMWATRSSRRR